MYSRLANTWTGFHILVGVVLIFSTVAAAENAELRAGIPFTGTTPFVDSFGDDCYAQNAQFSIKFLQRCRSVGLCAVQLLQYSCSARTLKATYRCVGNWAASGEWMCKDRPQVEAEPKRWGRHVIMTAGNVDVPRAQLPVGELYPDPASAARFDRSPAPAEAPLSAAAPELTARDLAFDALDAGVENLGNAERRALGLPVP